MTQKDDKSTAGAWSAAAIVVALGALGFGVAAHVRMADLESRLEELENAAPSVDAAAASTSTAPSTTNGGTASVADPVSEPPDPDSAAAEVSAAFGVLYDGSRTSLERLAAVDDIDGVDRALGQVQTGPFGEVARSVSVTVNSVSFTSDTRALVSYTLMFGGLAEPSERRGEARIVGGRWAVTRATVCSDLIALGASCAE